LRAAFSKRKNLGVLLLEHLIQNFYPFWPVHILEGSQRVRNNHSHEERALRTAGKGARLSLRRVPITFEYR
jgi:hypothetical protein